MRKKLNRDSPVRICGRRGINELMLWKTQDFGMSKHNGMQTLMIQGKRDFRAFGREKRLKHITSQLHSVVVPWGKTQEKSQKTRW